MSVTSFIYIALTVLVVFLFSILYLIIRRSFAEQKLRIAKESAKRVVEDAKRESDTIKKEGIIAAKDESIKLRNEFDKETKERKGELNTLEKRIITVYHPFYTRSYNAYLNQGERWL